MNIQNIFYEKNELEFKGFVFLENPIKKNTIETIIDLKNKKINNIKGGAICHNKKLFLKLHATGLCGSNAFHCNLNEHLNHHVGWFGQQPVTHLVLIVVHLLIALLDHWA